MFNIDWFKPKRPGTLLNLPVEFSKHDPYFIIAHQVRNWYLTDQNVGDYLFRGYGPFWVRLCYGNLCNTYGKHLVDETVFDIYKVSVAYV